MSTPIPTGGHRSRAAANVSHWLTTNPRLRFLALDCLGRERNPRSAARLFLQRVGSRWTPKPDYQQYSLHNVAHAIAELATTGRAGDGI